MKRPEITRVATGDPCAYAAPRTRRDWLRAAAAAACVPVLGAGTTAVLAQPAPAPAAEPALPKIRERGVLVAAVYRDFAPFHHDGKGIDVDLARELAKRLGVGMRLLPFAAGDDIGADLRNMVWRGHYMGQGVADLLLHVPVDRRIMGDNRRVRVFAPYYREKLAIARDLRRVPRLDSLGDLAGQRIAAEAGSLSSVILVSGGGSALREAMMPVRSAAEAVAAMLRGDASVAIATRSEIDAGLAAERADPARFAERWAVGDVPGGGFAQSSWAPGFAARVESEDLEVEVGRLITQMIESGDLERIFAAHGVRWMRP